MVRLNLSSDNVRNFEETTMFVKECEKVIKCKKKGNLNLAYKQGLLFEKFKESDKFNEMLRKMEQVKLVKVLEKYPKLKVLVNLNSFNDVEIC